MYLTYIRAAERVQQQLPSSLSALRAIVDVLIKTCGWLTSLPRILRSREIRTSLYSTRRKGRPGRCARAKYMRGCPALLTTPGRSPNSPSEKSTRFGLEHGRANSSGSGSGTRLALWGFELQQNRGVRYVPTVRLTLRSAAKWPCSGRCVRLQRSVMTHFQSQVSK
jgi:hypothetical protein